MKLLAPAIFKSKRSDASEIEALLEEIKKHQGSLKELADNPFVKRLSEIRKKNIHVLADGTLSSSSASTIESFDEKSPFGCNVKFWFQDVAGVLGEGSDATDLGDQIHKQIEHYLREGQDALGKEARAGKGNIDEMIKRYPVYQVERWINGLKIGGVTIKGKIDLTGRYVGDPLIQAIIDWKSSSDIQKWGKTGYQLTKDRQMIIYRQAAEQDGCVENLPMFHVYFGTRMRESEIVPTRINRQQLADGIGDTLQVLERMKNVARILDAREVTPDKKKCEIGPGGCTYQSICPHYNAAKTTQGADLMVSLMDRFKKQVGIQPNGTPAPSAPQPPAPPPPPPAPVAQAPAPAAPPSLFKKERKLVIQDTPPDAPQAGEIVAADPIAALKAEVARLEAAQAKVAAEAKVIEKEIPQTILPPDAPKSNPALAADPVPGFEAIPPPLKGRPPAPPEQHNTAAVPPAPAAPLPPLPPVPVQADAAGKSKGGRPKGAKNKPKDDVTSDEGVIVEVHEHDFVVFETNLMLGSTVKASADPKSYEMARADFGLKARVRPGADLEKVREKLSEMCLRGLVGELEKLRGE